MVIDNAVQLGVDHALGDPKGDEPRKVPVPKFVMTESKKQIHGRGPDDLIFGDGKNYLPRPKSNGGWFVGAAKRAKVQTITPHHLSHTAASLAISAGANVSPSAGCSATRIRRSLCGRTRICSTPTWTR